jgi:tetratricopeptide (TPR) repeat protein
MLMKKSVFIILVAITFIACTSKHDRLKDEITELEKKISEQTVVDKTDGSKLLGLYTDFAESFPEDTATHVILYNAARLAVAIDQPQKAVHLLEQLIDDYPDSELVPEAYIFTGFIYENILLDIDLAAKWYQLFLQDFPNHPMVEDIRITILNLGKSPEELTREYLSQIDDSTSVQNGK